MCRCVDVQREGTPPATAGLAPLHESALLPYIFLRMTKKDTKCITSPHKRKGFILARRQTRAQAGLRSAMHKLTEAFKTSKL